MTFRGLAVFSLATLIGSLSACRPSASIVRDVPAPPPASMPVPLPLPVVPPTTLPIIPESVIETEPRVQPQNPWKPATAPREWTSIVIHHTATDQGSVESIHETHIAKEWLGIGYHFVIGNGNGMPDGEIEPTFRWREQLHGAHAGKDEYNQHGIGIALIGNFEEQPPTPAQLASIKRLVAVLKSEYQIDNEHVIGHSEVKATACPGKLFPMSEVSEVTLADLDRQRTRALAFVPKHPTRSPARFSSAGGVREPKRSAPLAVLSGSRLQ